MDPIEPGQKAARQKEITRRDVELFTELTGDRQALHYDEGLAARLGYLEAEAHRELSALCIETSKVLAGLLRALRP